MKHFILTLSYWFILPIIVSAQTTSLKPAALVEQAKKHGEATIINLFSKPVKKNHTKIAELKKFDHLDLNTAVLHSLKSKNNPFINLNIPAPDQSNLELELIEVFPFTTDFKLREAPSMREVPFDKGKHYRGIIKGNPNSIATLSVVNGEISGMVSSPDISGNLIIGKEKTSNSYIIYNDQQLSAYNRQECATPDSQIQYTKDELRGVSVGTRALTDCVRIYFEVDYDIYQEKGSTINASSFVTAIFNQVSTLYATEQIHTLLSEIVVWTQASPYNGSNATAMLNSFGSYRKGFNGDLAQLLSYKASGGIAYIDGLCRTNPAFSMSYAGINNSFLNVPTYSWTVEVVTHELGHLFGSQHTHACVWNGNNSAIDGCYQVEGSCANPGIPSSSVGGTIMSYCHLTNAGIKFSNGFGTQPGNIIRTKVANAKCLTACPGGGNGEPICDQIKLKLEIKTDNHPLETTWKIKDASNKVVVSGGPYYSPSTINTTEICLPEGCYTFHILDDFGDGICCNYGNGYYKLKKGSEELITGGAFKSMEQKSFCISDKAPTCSDGIKNGLETGIDCGGPNCPPCPTCNDGIKNGLETGIDCGGPNCPPCPTCNDGIKNGLETGIDCGGPNCPPCPTCNDGIKNGLETGIDCGGPNCPPCPTCNDGIKNGLETGIDCGGPNCPPCPTCNDGIKNGLETGIDCGGPNCPPCPTCSDGIKNGLETGIDCGGPNCSPCPTCNDGIKNGLETGIDCGGPNCPPCPTCNDGIKNGLETGIDCGGPNCPPCPTCNDGIKNGLETGIDCGGPNCPPCPTCNDGIKNGLETGIDCGGPNCPPCPTCSDGIKNGLETGIDCGGPNCPPCPTCSDGIKNGLETGIDCGGPNCPPCPTCSDGIKNGLETGIDCGGPNCPPCPTCNDGIKNGLETGIDCGGPNCPPCPTCSDGIKNGLETGIDCGGPNCPPCHEDDGRDETSLGGYYFENGWDAWISGGTNSKRLKTAYSPEGSYSIQLKGNDSESSSMTSPIYDLSKFDTIVIEFKLRTINCNTQDGFSFRYYNGKNWITVQQFIFKQDFNNSLNYTKKIILNGYLYDKSQFRFQANANNPNTQIYIDAITIKGIAVKKKSTCGDGIQNGKETGIDCGGPDCPPCNIEAGQEVTINGYYFENSWDSWISGGAYSKRLKTAYSPEGSYSIQLKGNAGEASSMISPEYDLSPYDTVTITFKLRAINLKTNDQLQFKYFNGSTWIENQNYQFKQDFSNSLIYTKTFKMYGNLSYKAFLAIQSSIEDDRGQIFIDAIIIKGIKKHIASCSDGIKNGLETGIDCGGPHCQPCTDNGDDSEISLAGYFFENGWDKWNGDNQGSIWHTGSPSPEGNHCIKLNHPYGNTTYMSSPIFNLIDYQYLNISFDFTSENMVDGERFVLQYFNGGRWIDLCTFIKGLDFDNGKVYNANYKLGGFLSPTAIFRIIKNISMVQSTLYIDGVILKAKRKLSLIQPILELREISNNTINDKKNQPNIRPNPATTSITIFTEEEIRKIDIFSTSGQQVKSIHASQSNEIDISTLLQGLYIVRIETAQNVYIKKLIKE
jgi:hypothetical protein